jgi:hypothetical protein
MNNVIVRPFKEVLRMILGVRENKKWKQIPVISSLVQIMKPQNPHPHPRMNLRHINPPSQEIVTGLGALVHPIVRGSEPVNHCVSVPIISGSMMIASVSILLPLNMNLVIHTVTLIKILFNIGKNIRFMAPVMTINPGQLMKPLSSNVFVDLHRPFTK